MNKKNILLVSGLIIALVAFRLLFNEMRWFGLFPIAGIGIFLGSSFKNKQSSYLILLGTMILTDLSFYFFVPGTDGFYSSQLFTYGSVLLIVLMGTRLNPNKWIGAIGFTIGGTLAFWLITNFGVWLTSGYYALNWVGFIECYAQAIPFYQKEGSQLFVNAFTANIAFSAIAFGIYNYALTRKAQLAKAA